jgi:hypothetical protein
MPRHIAAVDGGKALGNGKAVTVGLERLVELALRHHWDPA